MPVFKSAMKIAKQNIGLILIYLGIMILTTIMILTQGSSGSSSYEAEAVDIAFVDEDGSLRAQGLETELSRIHHLEKMENDPDVLQQRLYYRDAQYVVRVPAGFGEDPKEHPLQITEIPGSYAGAYLNQEIESYLRQVYLYETAGFSLEEALEQASVGTEPAVTVLQQEENSSTNGFFGILPYAAICMLCFAIGNVLCSFMQQEIVKRTNAAAISRRRTAWELLLAVSAFGVLVFVIFFVMGILLCKDFFIENLPYYLVNMAAVILVAIAISYVTAMFAKNRNSLGGIINTVSLGMSFLCGVFVPLQMLGSTVKTVAQFLPVYWYEKNVQLLKEFAQLPAAHVGEFWAAIGIQLVFAVALIAIGTTAHKKRM